MAGPDRQWAPCRTETTCDTDDLVRIDTGQFGDSFRREFTQDPRPNTDVLDPGLVRPVLQARGMVAQELASGVAFLDEHVGDAETKHTGRAGTDW